MEPLINMKFVIDKNILMQLNMILCHYFDGEFLMSFLVSLYLPFIFFTLINDFLKTHAGPCSELFYRLHDQVTLDFNYDTQLNYMTSCKSI